MVMALKMGWYYPPLFTLHVLQLLNGYEKGIINLIDTFVSSEGGRLYMNFVDRSSFCRSSLRFQSNLPDVFCYPIMMMLKETAKHPMIPVDHQQWLPYSMLIYKRLTDDLPNFCRLLRQLFKKKLYHYKDFNYFKTAKLVNVGKYNVHLRMYLHNTLTTGVIFYILTNSHKTNAVASAHC